MADDAEDQRAAASPGPDPARASRREVLAALADEGDAAAIASFLLAEGRVAPVHPGQPDAEVLGRTADLLGQHAGDSVALVGWIAALANGVTTIEGIEEWCRRAVRAAVEDPARRPVLWSEVRRGDLVVASARGELRAGVALDAVWGVHVGPGGIERVALVDLVDGADGPRVLRDKLWFWSSFGEAAPDPVVATIGSSDAHADERSRGGRRRTSQASTALWLGGAAIFGVLALVFGLVVLGDDAATPPPGPIERRALFPLEQLTLLDAAAGTTDLRWCEDGVPTDPYRGELIGIRIRSVDTYRFDDSTLLVDVTFLEPLDHSLAVLTRRAVRGYAVDEDGIAIGYVQTVEATPSGDEVRGRLRLDGELVVGSSGTVGVDRGFQFLLDLAAIGFPDEVRVAVDSLGGARQDSDRLPCHIVISDPIALG